MVFFISTWSSPSLLLVAFQSNVSLVFGIFSSQTPRLWFRLDCFFLPAHYPSGSGDLFAPLDHFLLFLGLGFGRSSLSISTALEGVFLLPKASWLRLCLSSKFPKLTSAPKTLVEGERESLEASLLVSSSICSSTWNWASLGSFLSVLLSLSWRFVSCVKNLSKSLVISQGAKRMDGNISPNTSSNFVRTAF